MKAKRHPGYHIHQNLCAGLTMGIALSISLLSSTLLTATVSVSLGEVGRILVADSYAEFSDVQGQGGWWYGYFEGHPPSAPEDFRQFPKFIGGARPAFGRWVIDEGSGGFWTSMSAHDCHPNGTTGSGGRQRVLHWAVRRWVSEVDGTVEISGTIFPYNRSLGNGVIAMIRVDGELIWERVIPVESWTDYFIPICLSQGAIVEFAIDPRDGDERWDDVMFTSRIFWLPRGDLNCDCSVNVLDIEPFILALFDPTEYVRRYPDCDLMQADINQDGSVDAFDIEPFIELLFP